MTMDALIMAAALIAVVIFAIMLAEMAVGNMRLKGRVEKLEKDAVYVPQYPEADPRVKGVPNVGVIHFVPRWMEAEEYFRTVCRGSWWPPRKDGRNIQHTADHKVVTCKGCINKMNHNKTTRENELIWKE